MVVRERRAAAGEITGTQRDRRRFYRRLSLGKKLLMSKSWGTAFALDGIMALTVPAGSVHAALWLFGSGLAAMAGLRLRGKIAMSEWQRTLS